MPTAQALRDGLRPFRRHTTAPATAHRFVQFLWAEINAQRVSQEDVAERSGWSSSAMRKWKCGDRPITLQALEDTLAVLGFELVIREIGDERVRCASRRPRAMAA